MRWFFFIIYINDKHLIEFSFFQHRKFNLIESKETDVLRDLEIALRLTEDPTASSETNTTTSTTTTTTTSSDDCDSHTAAVIDGDATIKPIVTQPESGQPPGDQDVVGAGGGGGGGGLSGTIGSGLGANIGCGIHTNTQTTA